MQYGYFDNVNREYVINRPDVPVSWTNYLGVRDMCSVISHNAGGYSFHKSSEHHRITRFRQNGIPMDRPGHYVYLRDDDSKDYWSVSWQPVGKDLEKAKYECRHGLSYSKFTCDYSDIKAEQTLFIPIDDDVELWKVKIKNSGDVPRKISVFSYLEFSFQHISMDNQNLQMSLYACGSSYENGIINYDLFYDPESYHYFTANFEPDGYDCLRDKFIGGYRTETNPIAVEKGECANSTELGGNHCGSLHKRLEIEAGQEVELVFMLGVGRNKKAKEIRAKYSNIENVEMELSRLADYWEEKLTKFQCETPNKGLDTMINIWNLYQAETNVVWSRFASFIEVGGRTGLGYRDTAQDVMCIPHSNVEKTKQRIIELLRGQTSEGYGLHLFEPEWFYPESKKVEIFKSPTVVPTPDLSNIVHGIKDVCSDDALWLVASICEFIKETGDKSFLEEIVTFADGGDATIYEHMKRILDFSTKQVGETGICKGLRADWNDCLNLGGGESALVSFLHYWALQEFVELAKYLERSASSLAETNALTNDKSEDSSYAESKMADVKRFNTIEDVDKYTKIAENVKKVCEENLWDKSWYIRGITSKGAKIGTSSDEEGKVHLESNTWAVVSGVASKEHGEQCMDSVDEYLYSDYGLHLVAPSYSIPNDDIGFVTRVYRGIKENGAIFSHPNPWAWVAECKLGRGDKAMKYYNALLPYNYNDKVEIREAEPYSYCQFIMGKDHTAYGRGRHPWLTGSAGWAYAAATKYMLGIRFDFDGMIIDPCIPADWQEFKVTRKWRGATYHITVKNPDKVQKGIQTITLNGKVIENSIKPQLENSINEILVIMG